MEGSKRLLHHFKFPNWRHKRDTTFDYETLHQPCEYPPEFHRGCDERTITTNRLKKFSKNLDLKKLRFKKRPSKPPPSLPAVGKTRKDLLAGLAVEGNKTGARDDGAIEADTMEEDLEHLLRLERDKSEGETGARHYRPIGTGTREGYLEHLLLQGQKKTEGEKKSWRKKSSWRKKKSGKETKIEGLVWPDSPVPPNTKRLPFLLRKDPEAGRKRDGERGVPLG